MHRNRITSVLVGSVCLIVLAQVTDAKNLSVEPDRSGAFPTIQAAIDAAAAGDSILLAPGTYTGEGNRDIEMRGKAIAIVGVDGPRKTILDCQGRAGDPHRGFFLHEREGLETVIRGITVTRGYAEGKLPASYGGAILCMHSSPTIEDCWFIDNESSHFGGAMVCYQDASPTLRRTRFVGNRAVNNGGGFGSKKKCHPRIEESLFVRNSAKRGGGIWCWDAAVTLDHSTLYENEGSISTGGVWSSQARIKIRNSIIARSRGKALACSNPPAEMKIKNCNLFGNGESDALPPCAIDEGGNFSLDPGFSNPEEGDFRLLPDSPCAPGHHPDGLEIGRVGAAEVLASDN